MKNYILTIALCFTFSGVLPFAYADELACVQNGEGWALKNITKNFIFGNPKVYLYSKADCERAKDTQQMQEDGLGVVCAPNFPVLDIYLLSGQLLKRVSYQLDPNYCFKSLAYMTDFVACVPSSSLPGAFYATDLKAKNKMVGNGYYSLKGCIWSSSSARAEDKFICGAKDSYTVIYDRFTNKPANNQKFSTVQDCYRSLRGDY